VPSARVVVMAIRDLGKRHRCNFKIANMTFEKLFLIDFDLIEQILYQWDLQCVIDFDGSDPWLPS